MMDGLSTKVLPGRSIGEFSIGMPIAKLMMVLDLPTSYSESGTQCKLQGLYTIRYDDKVNSVHIYADIRAGIVKEVTGRDTFPGTTPSGISIGMKVSKALSLDPTLYLDERDGVLLSKAHPGLFLELEDPDPLPEEIYDMAVEGIGVNDPALCRDLFGFNLPVDKIEKVRAVYLNLG